MLYSAGRSVSRSNNCVDLPSIFERVIKRCSNAGILPHFHSNTLETILEHVYFCLPVRTRVKRYTNVNLMSRFHSNACQTLHECEPSVLFPFERVSNTTLTWTFYFISTRTRYQMLHEREPSVSILFERVIKRSTNARGPSHLISSILIIHYLHCIIACLF